MTASGFKSAVKLPQTILVKLLLAATLSITSQSVTEKKLADLIN